MTTSIKAPQLNNLDVLSSQ
jgi:hypothetical protein